MSELRRIRLQNNIWRDERGWGLSPLEAAGLPAGAAPGSLHVVSLEPGAVRGNHVHPDATEWFLLCGGPAEIAWQSAQLPPRRESILPDDGPALYEVPPGVAHAVRNRSRREIILLAFSNAPVRKTLPCQAPLFAQP